QRRGPLDAGERDDLRRLEPRAGHREVLDRPLRLRRPEGLGGHADLAHRVVLDAVGPVLAGHAAPSAESRWSVSASPTATRRSTHPSASRYCAPTTARLPSAT